MPNFPGSIPRVGRPIFHEASPQRSIRDLDSIPQSHKKHQVNGFQTATLANQVAELTRQMHRLRIRKSIPTTAGGTLSFGEWFSTETNKLNDIRVISTGLNSGTYIYVNNTPSAGNAPYAGNGFWVQFPIGGNGNWI